MPFNTTALLISPDAITLTFKALAATKPACFRANTSISYTANKFSSLKRTSALFAAVNELKPRLGKRRCKGI